MSAKPRVRLITPVWGEFYIKRWLDLCLASQRSENNLPYMNAHCDLEFIVVTGAGDAQRLSADPAFNGMMNGIRVRYISLDEFLPKTGKTSYGVPLTLAYAKAIIDPGTDPLGSYVILMNADCVVADGSLKAIVDRIEAGFTIISASSIRTVDGTARASLHEYVDKRTGILTIKPREMMSLANKHLHSTVTGRIINDDSPIDSTYYHQIFWRISDDCLAMRAFLLQPLCFRIDRIMEKVVGPVDYGFLTEFCPNGKFCVLNDTDDYLMFELQEQHSESHWLRPAAKFATPQARLSNLADEIIQHVSTWTTAEQRRSATKTLFYHSGDLPADLPARVAPFEAFVDALLNRLPPPVPHTRHFQWLPAVRNFRDDMARGGSSQAIALLDDPQNDYAKPPAAIATKTPLRDSLHTVLQKIHSLAYRHGGSVIGLLRPIIHSFLRRVAPTRVYREQLGDHVAKHLPAEGAGSVDIAYIGDIQEYSPAPPPKSRVVILENPDGSDNGQGSNLRIPPHPSGNEPAVLVLYAGVDFLAHWSGMEEDIDALLARRKKIVLVFIREAFTRLPFKGHTYLLSTLLNCLPRQKFRMALDVYVAPRSISSEDMKLLHPLHAAVACMWLWLTRLFNRSLRPNRPTGPQAEFSALIVPVERR